MKKNSSILKLCVTALFIALTYLATALIQIPIPLGYSNLGDSVILLTAFLFSPGIACISGALGASLADLLTGYAIWSIPTLIIKFIIALIACLIMGKTKKKMYSVKTIIAAIASMVFMVAGYVFAGAILYGSVGAGIASAPGLIAEAVINIIVFYFVGTIIEKSGIQKNINF